MNQNPNRQLQTFSETALPAVDVAEPASLLLLPQWLNEQISTVSDLGAGRTVIDPTTREVVRRVATMPRSKLPTGPQRAAIRRRITELHEAARPGPMPDMLEIIGKLVLRYSTARTDEASATVTIEGYEDALSDLPAWTVREAIRRWRRGEIPAGPDERRFAPSEARLRQAALMLLQVVQGQAARLQRVLDAEAEDDLSTEEASDNERRLLEMSKDIQRAASMEPPRPSGRTPAEQDKLSRDEAAYWQRQLAKMEAGNDAA